MQKLENKLEYYEQKVYENLHNALLKDEGVPDLDQHRQNLLKQIKTK